MTTRKSWLARSDPINPSTGRTICWYSHAPPIWMRLLLNHVLLSRRENNPAITGGTPVDGLPVGTTRGPALDQRWASVDDAGPALNQRRDDSPSELDAPVAESRSESSGECGVITKKRAHTHLVGWGCYWVSLCPATDR